MEPSTFRITLDRAPVEIAASVLRGRWAALILWNLFWGGKGFYELLGDTAGISRRELVEELEALEALGLLVHRRGRQGPRLQYVLAPLGDALRPVLAAMHEWGLQAREATSADVLRPEVFQAAIDAGARPASGGAPG
jgi:DNA-binding HxlR family transcriptional regulator